MDNYGDFLQSNYLPTHFLASWSLRKVGLLLAARLVFSEVTSNLIPSISGTEVEYFYLASVFTILSFWLPRSGEVRVLDFRLSHHHFCIDIKFYLALLVHCSYYHSFFSSLMSAIGGGAWSAVRPGPTSARAGNVGSVPQAYLLD
jgi:hypothetical protein